MLLRQAVRTFTVQQLIAAATDAGSDVFENRALPEKARDLPSITVSTPQERKEPQGRGSTLYTTVVTVRISARARGDTDVLAAAAADNLVAQIIAATLGSQAFLNFDGLQQVQALESSVTVNARGDIVVGDVEVGMLVELIERIDPTVPTPLTDINGTVTTTDGASLQFDAPLAQPPAAPQPAPTLQP